MESADPIWDAASQGLKRLKFWTPMSCERTSRTRSAPKNLGINQKRPSRLDETSQGEPTPPTPLKPKPHPKENPKNKFEPPSSDQSLDTTPPESRCAPRRRNGAPLATAFLRGLPPPGHDDASSSQQRPTEDSVLAVRKGPSYGDPGDPVGCSDPANCGDHVGSGDPAGCGGHVGGNPILVSAAGHNSRSKMRTFRVVSDERLARPGPTQRAGAANLRRTAPYTTRTTPGIMRATGRGSVPASAPYHSASEVSNNLPQLQAGCRQASPH